MRLKLPSPRRLKLPTSDRVKRSFGPALGGLGSVALEVLRIGREMLVIPAQIWLAVAEIAGGAVLAVWRLIWPLLVRAFELARRALAWGQANVKPAHAMIAVALVAAAALAASQFADYRGISVGVSAYSGVETVAPPPEVGREEAGSAHAWVMLPIAAFAAATVVVAALGRWRAARLLIPLGLIVIVVSLAIDAPKGLDEGVTATAYEGAEASLLEGFWAQLMAGIVLVLSGPLLVASLRGERGGAGLLTGLRHREQAGGGARLGSSAVGNPPIEGTSA